MPNYQSIYDSVSLGKTQVKFMHTNKIITGTVIDKYLIKDNVVFDIQVGLEIIAYRKVFYGNKQVIEII